MSALDVLEARYRAVCDRVTANSRWLQQHRMRVEMARQEHYSCQLRQAALELKAGQATLKDEFLAMKATSLEKLAVQRHHFEETLKRHRLEEQQARSESIAELIRHQMAEREQWAKERELMCQHLEQMKAQFQPLVVQPIRKSPRPEMACQTTPSVQQHPLVAASDQRAADLLWKKSSITLTCSSLPSRSTSKATSDKKSMDMSTKTPPAVTCLRSSSANAALSPESTKTPPAVSCLRSLSANDTLSPEFPSQRFQWQSTDITETSPKHSQKPRHDSTYLADIDCPVTVSSGLHGNQSPGQQMKKLKCRRERHRAANKMSITSDSEEEESRQVVRKRPSSNHAAKQRNGKGRETTKDEEPLDTLVMSQCPHQEPQNSNVDVSSFCESKQIESEEVIQLLDVGRTAARLPSTILEEDESMAAALSVNNCSVVGDDSSCESIISPELALPKLRKRRVLVDSDFASPTPMRILHLCQEGKGDGVDMAFEGKEDRVDMAFEGKGDGVDMSLASPLLSSVVTKNTAVSCQPKTICQAVNPTSSGPIADSSVPIVGLTMSTTSETASNHHNTTADKLPSQKSEATEESLSRTRPSSPLLSSPTTLPSPLPQPAQPDQINTPPRRRSLRLATIASPTLSKTLLAAKGKRSTKAVVIDKRQKTPTKPVKERSRRRGRSANKPLSPQRDLTEVNSPSLSNISGQESPNNGNNQMSPNDRSNHMSPNDRNNQMSPKVLESEVLSVERSQVLSPVKSLPRRQGLRSFQSRDTTMPTSPPSTRHGKRKRQGKNNEDVEPTAKRVNGRRSPVVTEMISSADRITSNSVACEEDADPATVTKQSECSPAKEEQMQSAHATPGRTPARPRSRVRSVRRLPLEKNNLTKENRSKGQPLESKESTGRKKRRLSRLLASAPSPSPHGSIFSGSRKSILRRESIMSVGEPVANSTRLDDSQAARRPSVAFSMINKSQSMRRRTLFSQRDNILQHTQSTMLGASVLGSNNTSQSLSTSRRLSQRESMKMMMNVFRTSFRAPLKKNTKSSK